MILTNGVAFTNPHEREVATSRNESASSLSGPCYSAEIHNDNAAYHSRSLGLPARHRDVRDPVWHGTREGRA